MQLSGADACKNRHKKPFHEDLRIPLNGDLKHSLTRSLVCRQLLGESNWDLAHFGSTLDE